MLWQTHLVHISFPGIFAHCLLQDEVKLSPKTENSLTSQLD